MKKFNKLLSVLLAFAMLASIFSVVIPSASANTGFLGVLGEGTEETNPTYPTQELATAPVTPEGKQYIYFDVNSTGWGNVRTVYCHIWKADGSKTSTGEDWNSWQAKNEKCEYDKETGIATYDLAKIDHRFKETDGNIYCVIFSVNTGMQTYNTIMNGNCIGDIAYCVDNMIENPEDSEKKVREAYWRSNPDCGPQKKITSTGNIIGTAYTEGMTDAGLVAEYLISYCYDPEKTARTQYLLNELNVSPAEVMYEVWLRVGNDDKGYIIENILDDCEDTKNKGPKVLETEVTLGTGEVYWQWLSANENYSFVSSNPDVAVVDENGYINALEIGETTITVTAQNGKRAFCDVTVKKGATSIRLEKSSYVLENVNEQALVNAIIDEEGYVNPKNYNWSSSDESVVIVTYGGKTSRLIPRGVGTATITVSVNNGLTASAKVTVKGEQVTLNKKAFTLGVGESYTPTATITPEGANTTMRWYSSNESVATVDSNGKVTAKKTGTTLITVVLGNSERASCEVTVKKAPTAIKPNYSSFTLGVGESYTVSTSVNSGEHINNHSIKWSNDNSKVASIKKQSGGKLKVTAKATGKATITVKTYNGKTAKITVTVKKAPSAIKVNKTKFTLGVGESYVMSTSVTSGSAASNFNRVWTSSNTKVVTVKKQGGGKAEVVAKGVGTATITVKTYNGKTAKATVTVKKAPESVKVNKTKFTLGVGESYVMSSTLSSDSWANTHSLTWTSSNKKVLTVAKLSGGKAKVTAKGVGTATVTIKTYNGKTAKATVTVKKAPSVIKLNNASLTLNKGKTYTLSSTIGSNEWINTHSLSWSTSNKNVVTVKKQGNGKAVITAKGKGTATITVKTYNGKTAKCKVTVK